MTKLKTIFFAASALALLGVSACKDPSDGTGGGNIAPPDAPFVEGGASLILSPDKLDIEVRVTTADGTSVTVEGCDETTLTSGIETVLHAKGSLVILKGKITSLDCSYNRLAALNVQGLKNLKWLDCYNNRLTALNVQGLIVLSTLSCYNNQLTALDVQGCTYLQNLYCNDNQLTSLNVQGLTALQTLNCFANRLTALNVQGLTALQTLYCNSNQLTSLNVQGLTALQTLFCNSNQLTSLNVQGCTALQELNCDSNKLTALNVQGCTALGTLYCSSNRLTADAFKKLFDDLPVRADGYYRAACNLYTEQTGVTEGNHTYFSAPPDLSDAFNNAKTVKKWKMYKFDADGHGVKL